MGYPFYIISLLALAAVVMIFVQRQTILKLRRRLTFTSKQYKDLVSAHEHAKNAIRLNLERHDFKIKLISLLAHDFRGAFMNIIALMDFYEKGEVPAESFSNLFEELKSTSRKNLNEFESTLVWVKTQMDGYEFRAEPVNISKAIANAVRNNSSEIKRKEITLSVKGDHDVEILANIQLLSFVLNSLVNNAVKFSLPGASVDCVIRKEEESVQVHVTDFGVGMKAKTLDAIFSHDKTIYTGTLGEKGAGIALVISKDFVEIQHGSLEAVSEEGTGSVFTLSLPAA